jgi:hypothetical protein
MPPMPGNGARQLSTSRNYKVPLARSPGAYLHEILDSRARFHNRVFIRYHQLQLLGEQKEITEVMSRKLGIAQPLSPQSRFMIGFV